MEPRIKEEAYAGYTQMTHFIVPDGTVEIGARAFQHCHSLKKVYIPASVLVIGRDVFYDVYGLEIYCEDEPKPGWIDETVIEHKKYEITTPEDDAFNFHRSGGSFSTTTVERDEPVRHCWNIMRHPVHTHVPKSVTETW